MRALTTAIVLALGATVVATQQPPANYDEARVPAYTLPALLVAKDGSTVRSAADWAKRRAEISALLEEQMFGKAPAKPAGMTVTVDAVDRAALGGSAVRKLVTIRVAGKTLALLLYLPARSPRPVPVFVSLGFDPNQAVNADPAIPLAGPWAQDPATKAIARRPPDATPRGSSASRWGVETLVGRGFGLATMYYGDIEPDIVGAAGVGVRAAYPGGRASSLSKGQAPAAGAWGSIAAWAWGLSRIADYLGQDRDVDARRLALVGHSRLGKTALWAGALDPRFAIVISNDSGEGGAAISRRKFGETVADLNSRFPHWFCGNYKQYNGREETMPFDSHMLLSLVAPRPLYVASAADDQWADPKGEFLGAVAASEVYRLLGRKGLDAAAAMPAIDHPVGDGDVRYHVRTGKHDITAYDWRQYLDFAARQFSVGDR
jgi:hypothetical protein